MGVEEGVAQRGTDSFAHRYNSLGDAAVSGILFENEVNSRAMPNKLFPALDTA